MQDVGHPIRRLRRRDVRAATAALLAIAVAWCGACGDRPALVRQREKVGLVDDIRRRLLESVEAEKSAVLATTDEESTELANQSRRSAAEIDRLRMRLAELIAADGRPEERDKEAAFTARWDALQEIDARLLALAVGNTNLKAARLLGREASAALDRFIASVDAMTLACPDVAAVRSLTSAATAVARIQSLLAQHIPERSEAEMTALELRMRALAATVDGALGSAASCVPSTAPRAVTDATDAWAEYRRIMEEVIRLSRLNTNVISFDISTHEKRAATGACSNALAELRSAIAGGPVATR